MSDADEDPITQYVRPFQMDTLRDLGYITDGEREEMRTTGFLTVENADGDDVRLCPDMMEAPSTIGPIITTLGDRPTGSRDNALEEEYQ